MKRCAIPKSLNFSDSFYSQTSDQYDFFYYDSKTQLPDDIEIIIGNPPKVLPNNLKWIQLTAAGFDHIDLDTLKSHNIHLTNGSGTTSNAIAEYVIGAILYTYKNFGAYQRLQLKSLWNPLENGRELTEAKVAILGTGHIGQAIAKRMEPFGVSITGFNSNGRNIDGFTDTNSLDNFHKSVHNYDIIIAALPLNDATLHLIDANILNSMKPDALLINVGRGAVVKLSDLESCIDSTLSSCILDVFEIEPLPKSSPLWLHEKVLITPHISYQSQLRIKNLETLILNNLRAYTHQEPLKNIIL